MTTESSPRANLRAAIAACDSAKEDVQRAESILRAANETLTKLLSKGADYASLDDEISAARASHVAHAIKTEGPIPTDTPPGFASKLIARDKIEEELGAVRQTIPSLESELASAKQRAEQCAYEIDLCVEAVFVSEAEEIAGRYAELLREARELLYCLRFMGAKHVKRDPSQRRASTAPTYWGNEVTRQIKMPESVLHACADDCLGQSEYREGLRKRDMVSASVSAFFAALHSNPDAQLEIAELPPAFDADALLANVRAEMAKSA